MTTIYFDLETGGVEPHHPNIQIAAVALDCDREIEAFECKIKFDETLCMPEALELNSYDAETWAYLAKPEKYAIESFVEFCQRHASIQRISKSSGRGYYIARLAGHNVATFDFPRLLERSRALGVFLPVDFPPLDTYQLAAWHFADREPRPENLKLNTLCEWFEVHQQLAHDALSDVRATAKIAACLRASFKQSTA